MSTSTMKVFAACILLGCASAIAEETKYCPTGGEIYDWGMTQEGIDAIVSAHNMYRQRVLDGEVPNQPRGKNIKMMEYDSNLENEAKRVSCTCEPKHVNITDDRWDHVGQNIYTFWNSVRPEDDVKGQKENWAAVAETWFKQNTEFTYPNITTGYSHQYTQMIWDDSNHLGCDYISFYDTTRPLYPYAKIFTCNYGPGGNVKGEAPYELA